jgi:hypothetical protein
MTSLPPAKVSSISSPESCDASEVPSTGLNSPAFPFPRGAGYFPANIAAIHSYP